MFTDTAMLQTVYLKENMALLRKSCAWKLFATVTVFLSMLSSSTVETALMSGPVDTVAIEGVTIHLCCSSNLSDAVQWSWIPAGTKIHQSIFHGSGVIVEHFRDKYSVEISTDGYQNLTIHNVRLEDAGTYTCTDEKGFGLNDERVISAELTVLGIHVNCTTDVGQSGQIVCTDICDPSRVNLSCSVAYRGNILPSLRWTCISGCTGLNDKLLRLVTHESVVNDTIFTSTLRANVTADMTEPQFSFGFMDTNLWLSAPISVVDARLNQAWKIAVPLAVLIVVLVAVLAGSALWIRHFSTKHGRSFKQSSSDVDVRDSNVLTTEMEIPRPIMSEAYREMKTEAPVYETVPGDDSSERQPFLDQPLHENPDLLALNTMQPYVYDAPREPPNLEEPAAWTEPQCLIEFVTKDEDKKSDKLFDSLRLVEETLVELRRIKMNLAVVSVIGQPSTGISYLTNCIAGKMQQPGGFRVGKGKRERAKTMPGIWVWCLSHPTKHGCRLLLVDADGLSEHDSAGNAQLVSLVGLLSSIIVYNSKGPIDEKAINDLRFVNELSKQFRISSPISKTEDMQRFAKHYPKFEWSDALSDGRGIMDTRLGAHLPALIWVARDSYRLSHVNTSDDYLENILRQYKKESYPCDATFNETLLSIRWYFATRSCFLFPLPVTDSSLLTALDKLSYTDLDREFVASVDDFCAHVYQQAQPLAIGGIAMNGEILGYILEDCVRDISSKVVPSLEKAVLRASVNVHQAVLADCFQFYMYAVTHNFPAWSYDSDLIRCHERCVHDLAEVFSRRIMVLNKITDFGQSFKDHMMDVYIKIHNMIAGTDKFNESTVIAVTSCLEELQRQIDHEAIVKYKQQCFLYESYLEKYHEQMKVEHGRLVKDQIGQARVLAYPLELLAARIPLDDTWILYF